MRGIAALLLAVLALGVLPRLGAAEEGPLLEYSVGVVSNRVSKGEDVYLSTFDRESKPHGAAQVTPAFLPAVTLHGDAGFALGISGNFALRHRKPEPERNFDGLETLDEVGYALSWSWKNRLGEFSAAWEVTTVVPAREAGNEVVLSFAPAVLSGIGATLTHRVVPDAGAPSGATYTEVAIGGGESLTWGLLVGQSVKPQEVTGSLGYKAGGFAVSLNASYRPNPERVGPYDEDGHYLVNGVEHSAPAALFWLGVSWSGEVAR